jgi:hypothetical protein
MSIAPPDPPPGAAPDEVSLTGAAPGGAVSHLPPDWSPPGTRRGADGFLVPEHFVDPPTRRGSLARRHEHLLASAARVRAVVEGEFARGGIVPSSALAVRLGSAFLAAGERT